MRLYFEAARADYVLRYPHSPFFETWVPREKFLGADIDDEGNFLIAREDEGIYGLALGATPKIPNTWKNFSMESQGITALPEEFKKVAEWDCYWAATKSGEPIPAATASDEEIAEFLKTHAPDSSVMPGNDEIIQWVEIRDETQLIAIAALCRWESGGVVISSVATHSDFRGRGLGKELINRCLIAGSQIGEKSLSLGVRHQNEAAHRLYAATGFTLMHNFTYCERR